MENLPKNIIKQILWYLDFKSYSAILRVSKFFNKIRIDYDLSNFVINIPADVKFINCSSYITNFINFNNTKYLNLIDYDENIDIDHKFDVVKLDISRVFPNVEINNGINTSVIIGNYNDFTINNKFIKKVYCNSVFLCNDLDYLECNYFNMKGFVKIKTLKLKYIDNFDYNKLCNGKFPEVNKLIFKNFNNPFYINHIKNIKSIVFENCSEEFITFNMSRIIEEKIAISFI